MQVDVNYQPDREEGDTRMALVAVTNKGDAPCRVEGRAAISLVNPADEVVDVPTENVAEPGKSVPSDLDPGESAFQGIKWTICDISGTDCGVGNTLRFNLEAGTDGPVAKLAGFPAPEDNNITMADLKIGTLQPSPQGVVAW